MPLTSRPHKNVFISLYEIARLKQEKCIDSTTRAKQLEVENQVRQCTFKPDFSKTQRNTERYLRNRPSKSPEQVQPSVIQKKL